MREPSTTTGNAPDEEVRPVGLQRHAAFGLGVMAAGGCALLLHIPPIYELGAETLGWDLSSYLARSTPVALGWLAFHLARAREGRSAFPALPILFGAFLLNADAWVLFDASWSHVPSPEARVERFVRGSISAHLGLLFTMAVVLVPAKTFSWRWRDGLSAAILGCVTASLSWFLPIYVAISLLPP